MAKIMENDNPKTFKQASNNPIWQDVMQTEFTALIKNSTWDLVPLPLGKNIVDCKWVYRTKYNSTGAVEKYKACLVAKRFSQNIWH